MKEIIVRVYIIIKDMKLWLGYRLFGVDLVFIIGFIGWGVVGGEGLIWSLLILGVVWYVYLVFFSKYFNLIFVGFKFFVRKGSYWGTYLLVMFGVVIGA